MADGNPELDTLRAEVRELRHDVLQFAAYLRCYAGRRVASSINDAMASGRGAQAEALVGIAELRHYLESRPLATAAVALGLGFVLGALCLSFWNLSFLFVHRA